MSASPTDERLPVWDALSEFFLDTELQPEDYERIAEVLARSKYSVEEIEAILLHEVYPECKWNLISVAGEWAGFDQDWIMKRIAPRKDKRPAWPLPPLLAGMYRDHWARVAPMIERKRVP